MVAPGQTAYLAVAGAGLDTANEIGVSGRDITLDGSQANWGTTSDGYPSVVVPLYVSPGAAPGGRTLKVDNDAEIALFTGAIKVVAP